MRSQARPSTVGASSESARRMPLLPLDQNAPPRTTRSVDYVGNLPTIQWFHTYAAAEGQYPATVDRA